MAMITCTIHQNGTCTLKGVHVKTLRSLLTQAALRRFATMDADHKSIANDLARADLNEHGLGDTIRGNVQSALAWFRAMRQTPLAIEDAMFAKSKYHISGLALEIQRNSEGLATCPICGAFLDQSGQCFRGRIK